MSWKCGKCKCSNMDTTDVCSNCGKVAGGGGCGGAVMIIIVIWLVAALGVAAFHVHRNKSERKPGSPRATEVRAREGREE